MSTKTTSKKTSKQATENQAAAKEAAKQAKLDEKAKAKQAKLDEKAKAKQTKLAEKQAAKEAAKQTKLAEKQAAKEAAKQTKLAEKQAKQTKLAEKAKAKNAKIKLAEEFDNMNSDELYDIAFPKDDDGSQLYDTEHKEQGDESIPPRILAARKAYKIKRAEEQKRIRYMEKETQKSRKQALKKAERLSNAERLANSILSNFNYFTREAICQQKSLVAARENLAAALKSKFLLIAYDCKQQQLEEKKEQYLETIAKLAAYERLLSECEELGLLQKQKRVNFTVIYEEESAEQKETI